MTELDSINAVCFVTQAFNSRLTLSQNYIIKEILEIYGKDVAENFISMITFCDGDNPKILEALMDETSLFN